MQFCFVNHRFQDWFSEMKTKTLAVYTFQSGVWSRGNSFLRLRCITFPKKLDLVLYMYIFFIIHRSRTHGLLFSYNILAGSQLTQMPFARSIPTTTRTSATEISPASAPFSKTFQEIAWQPATGVTRCDDAAALSRNTSLPVLFRPLCVRLDESAPHS